MRAKLVPWSSVVGQVVLLIDAKGRAVGQLSVRSHDAEADPKEAAQAIAKMVVQAINTRGI